VYAKKIIQNVLVKKLEPYGFMYDSYVCRRWILKKTLENGVEQYITVAGDPHSNDIRLEMNTSVDPRGISVEQSDERIKLMNYLSFSNDDEFIHILERYSDFIIDYGLKKLDEISVQLFKFFPDYEMYLYLYENNKKLENEFIFSNNLNNECSLEEGYTVIKRIIEEEKFDSESKQRLLRCVAFFSNNIINTFGGNWEWNNRNKDCTVNYINEIWNPKDFLMIIALAWQESKYDRLEKTYERIRSQVIK